MMNNDCEVCKGSVKYGEGVTVITDELEGSGGVRYHQTCFDDVWDAYRALRPAMQEPPPKGLTVDGFKETKQLGEFLGYTLWYSAGMELPFWYSDTEGVEINSFKTHNEMVKHLIKEG